MEFLFIAEIFCIVGLIYSVIRARDKENRKKFSTLSAVFLVILIPVGAFKVSSNMSSKDPVEFCNKKDAKACLYLAIQYRDANNISEAITFFKKACDYGNIDSCTTASYYLSKNSKSEKDNKDSLIYALEACHKGDYLGCFNAACSYCDLNDHDSSLAYFEKSFTMGYRNWNNIETDKEIDCIREMPGFKKIMANKPKQ